MVLRLATTSETTRIPRVTLQLTWSEGTLLEANDVTRPWATNNSTSSFTITHRPPKFYKVQVRSCGNHHTNAPAGGLRDASRACKPCRHSNLSVKSISFTFDGEFLRIQLPVALNMLWE